MVERCRSVPVVVRGVVVPGWWRQALLGSVVAGLLLLGMGSEVTIRFAGWVASIFPDSADLLGAESIVQAQSVAALIFSAALIFLAFVFLVSCRRGQPSEFVVYDDRCEMRDGNGNDATIYWRDILLQEKPREDVWVETLGSGKSRYQIIRMDILQDRQVVQVRLYFHLDPLRRLAPGYANVGELRYEFLCALLRARPELRVAVEIYTAFEVHPATLARDWRPKWFFGFCLGVYLLIVLIALDAIAVMRKALSVTAQLTLMVATILAGGLAVSGLQFLLFAHPDSPRARKARADLLGQGNAKALRAKDVAPLNRESVQETKRQSR